MSPEAGHSRSMENFNRHRGKGPVKRHLFLRRQVCIPLPLDARLQNLCSDFTLFAMYDIVVRGP